MKQHYVRNHAIRKKFKCNSCGKSYTAKRGLTRYRKTHSANAEPFAKRDADGDTIVFLELKDIIHGDSRDMLNFILDKPNICVVCLDYAGLTTNILDLQDIIRFNPNIKKIIVDSYHYENHFHKLNTSDLLNNQSLINVFDCRTQCKHRSK